jgi:hypothetical protein
VIETRRLDLACQRARTLAWVGEDLYDVAAGGNRLPLDGSPSNSRYGQYGSPFDAVVVAPEQDMVALVATAGTKGLPIGRDMKIIREFDRSFCQA